MVTAGYITAFLERNLRHRTSALAALVGANDPHVVLQQ